VWEMASDLGIVANTVILAILLHRRGLVPFDDMKWKELSKAAITAVLAGWLAHRVSQLVNLNGSRLADLKAVFLVLLTWAGAVAAGVWFFCGGVSRPFELR